jgi:hypothetical protein
MDQPTVSSQPQALFPGETGVFAPKQWLKKPQGKATTWRNLWNKPIVSMQMTIRWAL